MTNYTLTQKVLKEEYSNFDKYVNIQISDFQDWSNMGLFLSATLLF